MSTKQEHLRAINIDFADIHRRIGVICDVASSKEQQQCCLAADAALMQLQSNQFKALRDAYIGRPFTSG